MEAGQRPQQLGRVEGGVSISERELVDGSVLQVVNELPWLGDAGGDVAEKELAHVGNGDHLTSLLAASLLEQLLRQRLSQLLEEVAGHVGESVERLGRLGPIVLEVSILLEGESLLELRLVLLEQRRSMTDLRLGHKGGEHSDDVDAVRHLQVDQHII